MEDNKREKTALLNSEKYLNAAKRASELTGKNIELCSMIPEAIALYGHFCRFIYDLKSAGGIKIYVPDETAAISENGLSGLKAKEKLSFSEDELLAFVLSEYFYIFENKRSLSLKSLTVTLAASSIVFFLLYYLFS